MESAKATAVPTISTFSVTKGGKVAETYAVFQQWDLEKSLDDNLQQMREENPILAPTDAWLKEMRRIFRVRFSDTERHRPLIRLTQGGMAQETWAPILLWHLCFRELLLSDFLESWLFPRKQEGLLRVRADDVREYLGALPARGLLQKDWTPNTISRMTSGLPAYAADFGLLDGRSVKEVVPFHLPDEALLYVLHSLADETAASTRIVGDVRWRRFLLTQSELEGELLRLHQLRKLHFNVAGSLISLELPFNTLDEYADDLAG
jgi:hypothetical protein